MHFSDVLSIPTFFLGLAIALQNQARSARFVFLIKSIEGQMLCADIMVKSYDILKTHCQSFAPNNHGARMGVEGGGLNFS